MAHVDISYFMNNMNYEEMNKYYFDIDEMNPSIIGTSGNVGYPCKMFLDVLALLDTVHDFDDSEANNIGRDIFRSCKSKNWVYKYNELCLSFLKETAFNNITGIDEFPMYLASQLTSTNAAGLRLFTNNLETYCLGASIHNYIKTHHRVDAGNFHECFLSLDKNIIADLPNRYSIKKAIYDFFKITHNDPSTGSINLLVDTPAELTKVLSVRKEDLSPDILVEDLDNVFGYVLLQESICDAATSKRSPYDPKAKKIYGNKVYVEKYSQKRVYYPGLFESNYAITLNGVIPPTPPLVPPLMKSKGKVPSLSCVIEYYNHKKPTDAEDTLLCTLNGKPHPTNVPTITKNIGTILKTLRDYVIPEEKYHELLLSKQASYDFYNNKIVEQLKVNYPDDSDTIDTFITNITREFTKKRAGDILQANVCKYINEGIPGFSDIRVVNTTGPTIEHSVALQKLILVTLDRMLFAHCVNNDIPAIFCGSTHFLLFKPTMDVDESDPKCLEEKMKKWKTIQQKFFNDGASLIGGAKTETFSNVSIANKNNLEKKINDKKQKGGEGEALFIDNCKNLPGLVLKLLYHLINNSRLKITNHRFIFNNMDKIKSLLETLMSKYTRECNGPRIRQEHGPPYIFTDEYVIVTSLENKSLCLFVKNPKDFEDDLGSASASASASADEGDEGDQADEKGDEGDKANIAFDDAANEFDQGVGAASEAAALAGNFAGHFVEVDQYSKDIVYANSPEYYHDKELIICLNISLLKMDQRVEFPIRFIEVFFDKSNHLHIFITEDNPTKKKKGRTEITTEIVFSPEELLKEYTSFKSFITSSFIYHQETATRSMAALQITKAVRYFFDIENSIGDDEFFVDDDTVQVHDQTAGSQRGGGNNIPLLNMYYKYYFNNGIDEDITNNISPINLNKDMLTENNIVTIFSYLALFKKFEMNICFDIEAYNEDFERINFIEITNYVELYLLFYFLISEFQENHNKISYGLLEYFLNFGETKNINISFDLDKIVSYLFYDYKHEFINASTVLNDFIVKHPDILTNKIFTDTRQYFTSLYSKINTKSIEIKTAIKLNDASSQENIKFIKKYLNIYGFTIMHDLFEEILLSTFSVTEPLKSTVDTKEKAVVELKKDTKLDEQTTREQTVSKLQDVGFGKPSREIILNKPLDYYGQTHDGAHDMYGGYYKTKKYKNMKKYKKTRKCKNMKKTRKCKKHYKKYCKKTRKCKK